jgi:hypothetical protein
MFITLVEFGENNKKITINSDLIISISEGHKGGHCILRSSLYDRTEFTVCGTDIEIKNLLNGNGTEGEYLSKYLNK